jgi:hypothetical protein
MGSNLYFKDKRCAVRDYEMQSGMNAIILSERISLNCYFSFLGRQNDSEVQKHEYMRKIF